MLPALPDQPVQQALMVPMELPAQREPQVPPAQVVVQPDQPVLPVQQGYKGQPALPDKTETTEHRVLPAHRATQALPDQPV